MGRYCSKSSTLTSRTRKVIRRWESIQLLTCGLLLQTTGPVHETGRQEDQAEPALLFLDQIKREKGVWWMPWQ